MKKSIFLAIASIVSVGAGSQTAYDAATIAQRDLRGTARFVGMGGAMGALGGDISTIGTNPAGIGLYRSNDMMITLGYSVTGTESKYDGATFDADKYRWSFESSGDVYSMKVGSETALRYVNFAFDYHKSKSFYRNMSMSGLMGAVDGIPLSQARYMTQQGINNQAWLSGGNDAPLFDYGSDKIFSDPDAGWLGALAYQGWLNDEMPAPYYYKPYVPGDARGDFYSRERGGIDEYDANVSFNVKDRFYFGVTVGIRDVDYTKDTYYSESFLDQHGEGSEGYALDSWKRIRGTGFNVKLGMILRPFEYSSFRIGLAVHTPTYYDLTYAARAELVSRVYGEDPESLSTYRASTFDALGGRDAELDFDLQTPWAVNASIGYTAGGSLALGAEYEYENYRSMSLKDADGYALEYENNEMDCNLRAVHTLRLGAEWKAAPSFFLRAGYDYSTAAYEKPALKYMPDYSVATDTDFANAYGQHTATLGLGYHWPDMYIDLAYKFDTQKADFYPFFNELSSDKEAGFAVSDYDSQDYFVATPQATKVTNTRSQVVLTLGFRF